MTEVLSTTEPHGHAAAMQLLRSFTLYFLLGTPRKIILTAGIIILVAWVYFYYNSPGLRLEVAKASAVQEGLYAWRADNPVQSAPQWLSCFFRLQPQALLQNDVPLKYGNSLHADIRAKGAGRYSFWGESLYFSSSDNTYVPNSEATFIVAVKCVPLSIYLYAGIILSALSLSLLFVRRLYAGAVPSTTEILSLARLLKLPAFLDFLIFGAPCKALLATGLALLCLWGYFSYSPPTVRFEINSDRVAGRPPYGWGIPLPQAHPAKLMQLLLAFNSYALYENGTILEPADMPLAAVQEMGHGRSGIRKQGAMQELLFSSSDGSNIQDSAKSYHAVITYAPKPLLPVALLLIIWSGALLIVGKKRPSPSITRAFSWFVVPGAPLRTAGKICCFMACCLILFNCIGIAFERRLWHTPP